MKLFSFVCLIILVLEEYYCAPFLGWSGDEDNWNGLGGLGGCIVMGRHDNYEHSKTLDLLPKYSKYPTPLSGFERNYGKQYESPSYDAAYNTPYGITQRTPEGSPDPITQFGIMYGRTDSCWYDDGTPYKPDDTTYHPNGVTYRQYGPQYNYYDALYNQYGTPYNPYLAYNWHDTTYFPSGSPYSSYATYNIYTPSGKINCSPYGRSDSFLGYPSSNPWSLPISDVTTKPLQKPKQDIPSVLFEESPNKTEGKSSKKTVDKPLNKILDKLIDFPTTPLIDRLIDISSKALDDPSNQSLAKPSTISAEISSENLSDYSTVSSFDVRSQKTY